MNVKRLIQHFYSRAALSKYLFTNTLLPTLNKFFAILFAKTRRVVDAQKILHIHYLFLTFPTKGLEKV